MLQQITSHINPKGWNQIEIVISSSGSALSQFVCVLLILPLPAKLISLHMVLSMAHQKPTSLMSLAVLFSIAGASETPIVTVAPQGTIWKTMEVHSTYHNLFLAVRSCPASNLQGTIIVQI